jgi:hypothetical protein
VEGRQALKRYAAALGVAGWLGLAAGPSFAFMALVTGLLGGGQMAICGTAGAAAWLDGMVPMYLLMSVLHSAPWLKLIATRRGGGRRGHSGRRPAPRPAE